jgi:hypothetical protein
MDSVHPENSVMPLSNTKFVYQMFSIGDMELMEQSFNMDNVKNTPRKGVYSNLDEGFKVFNNHIQANTGSNAYKEEENDSDCKNRYVLVSVTAVEDNSSINMKFGAHNFA